MTTRENRYRPKDSAVSDVIRVRPLSTADKRKFGAVRFLRNTVAHGRRNPNNVEYRSTVSFSLTVRTLAFRFGLFSVQSPPYARQKKTRETPGRYR